MRGTLHLCAPEDAALLLAACGDRNDQRQKALHSKLGLTKNALESCKAGIQDLLQSHESVDRKQLVSRIDSAGHRAASDNTSHVIRALGERRVLLQISGRNGKGIRYTSGSWLPKAKLSTSQAIAKVASRYEVGHGPFRVTDLAKWLGQTKTSVASALKTSDHGLNAYQASDGEFWYVSPERVESAIAPDNQIVALPGFDEFHIGYADRALVLAERHLGATGPTKNGLFSNVVVSDGVIVGTWKEGPTGDIVYSALSGTDVPSSVAVAQVGELLSR